MCSHDVLGQPQLGVPLLARLQLSSLEHHAGGNLAGANVQVQFHPVLQLQRRTREQLQVDQQPPGRLHQAGGGQFDASGHLVVFHTCQVDRRTLPNAGVVGIGTVVLHAADPHLAALGPQFQRVPGTHLAADHAAGDNRAVTRKRDGPINRHPEYRLTLWQLHPASGLEQGLLECLDPLTGLRGDRHQRSPFQERASHCLLDLGLHQFHEIRFDQVGLGDRHHAGTDPQQIHDLQVFPSLGHHPVVGCDHQQRHVHPGGAGHHVLDEFLVTRDVDQPELKPVGFPVGKTQVDRNAAGLLFRQPVRIDTGQSPDESGLAVIDVPGGADQDMFDRRDRINRIGEGGIAGGHGVGQPE